jgi:hypothetical protein
MNGGLSLIRLLDILRGDFQETCLSRSDKTKETLHETAMILQSNHFSVIQYNCVSVYTIPHHPIIFQTFASICTHLSILTPSSLSPDWSVEMSYCTPHMLSQPQIPTRSKQAMRGA